MGFVAWILLGLIAGVLAKWIMPGKNDEGFILTIILGIVGSFVGGWIGSLFGMGTVGVLSLSGVLTAIVGALAILFIFRLIRK